jgi:hypothetical protein
MNHLYKTKGERQVGCSFRRFAELCSPVFYHLNKLTGVLVGVGSVRFSCLKVNENHPSTYLVPFHGTFYGLPWNLYSHNVLNFHLFRPEHHWSVSKSASGSIFTIPRNMNVDVNPNFAYIYVWYGTH